MDKRALAASVAMLFLLMSGCATGGVKSVTYLEINDRGCYVCQRMEPIIDEVEKLYGNQVNITTYSGISEGGADLIKKYNVKKFPANIFLDDKGAVFFRYEGLLDLQAIKGVLKMKNITGPEPLTQTSSQAVTSGAGIK